MAITKGLDGYPAGTLIAEYRDSGSGEMQDGIVSVWLDNRVVLGDNIVPEGRYVYRSLETREGYKSFNIDLPVTDGNWGWRVVVELYNGATEEYIGVQINQDQTTDLRLVPQAGENETIRQLFDTSTYIQWVNGQTVDGRGNVIPVSVGPQGPVGATGPAGPKGDKGDKGETGDRGPMGATGIQGVAGAKGADGTKITDIYTYYQLSSNGDVPPNGSWSATPPAPTKAMSYMWSQVTVVYNDSSVSNFYTVSRNGFDGRGIVSSAVTYQLSTSGTAAPTGTWTAAIPVQTDAQPYLWSRAYFTFTDSTANILYAVSKKGDKGDQGIQGIQGATGPTGPTGPDGLAVSVSPEGVIIPGSTTAAKASTFTVTVRAVKNSALQVLNVTGVSGNPTGMTYAINNNNTTSPSITLTVTTSMVTASGALTITFTYGGVTYTRYVTYAIAYTGATGATGATGSTGPQGVQGTTGETGATGSPGVSVTGISADQAGLATVTYSDNSTTTFQISGFPRTASGSYVVSTVAGNSYTDFSVTYPTNRFTGVPSLMLQVFSPNMTLDTRLVSTTATGFTARLHNSSAGVFNNVTVYWQSIQAA